MVHAIAFLSRVEIDFRVFCAGPRILVISQYKFGIKKKYYTRMLQVERAFSLRFHVGCESHCERTQACQCSRLDLPTFLSLPDIPGSRFFFYCRDPISDPKVRVFFGLPYPLVGDSPDPSIIKQTY